MAMPKDPVMLLSYVNTQLRDNYPAWMSCAGRWGRAGRRSKRLSGRLTMSTVRSRTGLCESRHCGRRFFMGGVVFDFNGTMFFDEEFQNISWRSFLEEKTG